MNQPDPAEIEAIAARAEAATPQGHPPQVRYTSNPRMGGGEESIPAWRWENDLPDGRRNSGPGFLKADAELYAHARTDLLALLAALATAEERAEKAERVIEPLLLEPGVLDRAHKATVEWEIDNDVDVLYWPLVKESAERLANYHKATGPQAENEEGS